MAVSAPFERNMLSESIYFEVQQHPDFSLYELIYEKGLNIKAFGDVDFCLEGYISRAELAALLEMEEEDLLHYCRSSKVLIGNIFIPEGYYSPYSESSKQEESIVLRTNSRYVFEHETTLVGMPLFDFSIRSVLEQSLGFSPIVFGALRSSYRRFHGPDGERVVKGYEIGMALGIANNVTLTGVYPGMSFALGRYFKVNYLGELRGASLERFVQEKGIVDKDRFDPTGKDPKKVTYVYENPKGPQNWQFGFDVDGENLRQRLNEPIGLAIPIDAYYAVRANSLDLEFISSLRSAQRDLLDGHLVLERVQTPVDGYSLQETIPIRIPPGYHLVIQAGNIFKSETGAVYRDIVDEEGSAWHLPSEFLDELWGMREGDPKEGKPIRCEVFLNELKKRGNAYIIVRVVKIERDPEEEIN